MFPKRKYNQKKKPRKEETNLTDKYTFTLSNVVQNKIDVPQNVLNLFS